MVEIGDIIGIMGDKPGPSAGISPALLFLQRIYKFIETSEEEPEPEKPDFLRASSLHRLCARREAIASVFPELPMPGAFNNISAGQQFTFDVGHAVHAWFQNKYIGPMGELWGHWFCNKCFAVTHTGLMPKKCKDCGTGRTLWIAFEHGGRVERAKVDNMLYIERSLVDNELGLTAHPDGLLYASDLRDIQQVFELKTISSDGYDKVVKANAAKPEHIIQTHAYMHLTGLRETFILYFDKGRQCEWKYTHDEGLKPGAERLSIHHVEFDDDLWSEIKAGIDEWWKARKLAKKDAVSADVTPFKRKCKNPMERMARDCPARDKCFALRAAK